MLFAIESDLQKHFEKISAFEIITDLKVVFCTSYKGGEVRGFRAILLLPHGQAQ
jgi:hypothetical protein